MHNQARNSIILICMTLLSRIVSFVRDASLAWLFGGTPLADAFTLAMRVPTLWRRLLAEGSLSLSLTSFFVRYPKPLIKKLAYRLFATVLVLVALGYFFRTDIMALLAPDAPQATKANAVDLFALTLPYCIFASLAAWRMARHHANGQYVLPACAPIIYSIVLIGTAFVCLMNPPLLADLRTPAFSMATAVLLGGMAQWLIQYLPSASPTKIDAKFTAVSGNDMSEGVNAPDEVVNNSSTDTNPTSADTSQINEGVSNSSESTQPSARFLLLGIFVAAVPQLAFCVAAALVSGFGAGHIAALYYAERLIEFPLGLFAVTTTLLTTPQLTRLIQRNNPQQTTKSIERILLLACCLNIPAAVGLFAIAEPATRLLFEHGSFTAPMTQLTSRSLMAYSLAIPAYALSRPLITLCTSAHTSRVFIIISSVSLCVVGLSGSMFTSVFGSIGAPLGVSVGLWMYTLMLWIYARKQYVFSLPLRPLGLIVVSAAVSFMAATMSLHLTNGVLSDWSSLLLSIVAGIVAYILPLSIMKNTYLTKFC